MDSLRRQGVTVEISGVVQQPFLPLNGAQLRLSGGGLTQSAVIQSYEYDEAAAADADAGTIDSAGNPRAYQITWTESPHFYRAVRLVVLYVGADPVVTKLLAGSLGPQFAGR